MRGIWRWGEREIMYLLLHCHHQNDFCIKMGSDESHFNVSLIVRDKAKRQCPQTTTFEEKGEPKRIRTEVPLLTSPNEEGLLHLHSLLRMKSTALPRHPCSLSTCSASSSENRPLNSSRSLRAWEPPKQQQ